MISTESTGRTVEEAVQKGLQELGIKRDNALVEILSEPSQGFLGLIGSKTARVVVSVRQEPSEYLQSFMDGLFKIMGLRSRTQISETEEQFEVAITGSQSGILIGRRGRTLHDLQYLLNSIMRRQFGDASKRVLVDVESYRYRRERTLVRLAEKTAQRVVITRHEIALEPMNSQERRIIHLTLQDHREVQTLSRGEEPYRRVVVAPR